MNMTKWQQGICHFFSWIPLFVSANTAVAMPKTDASYVQNRKPTEMTNQESSEYQHRLKKQINSLGKLLESLSSYSSIREKCDYISSFDLVKIFLSRYPEAERLIEKLPIESAYVVKQLLVLGQGPVIFDGWLQISETDRQERFSQLVGVLKDTEICYQHIGGVIGYHLTTIRLICDGLAASSEADSWKIAPPPYMDIQQPSTSVDKMIVNGLNAMEVLSEIYTVGGAGDRLNLTDEQTGMPLPVARLNFCGRTLLEGLIRDLQAREYLYYQLTGKQLRTPIILMTSQEKNNDWQIKAICKENGWFGRPQESICTLLQPLVPVLTVDGNWAMQGPCQPMLKPGGHGVLWKLAKDYGAFDWLQEQNRRYCLVRQINNPFAGLDHALLCLGGYGYTRQKAFGFVSCPRVKNMNEGMNVLREKRVPDGVACGISNVEYTEFAKRKNSDPQFRQIADTGNFPANTNILYANIAQIDQTTGKLPIPGLLVNMKQPVETVQNGKKLMLLGARLESTMQNIADAITDTLKAPVTQEKLDGLSTFVLLNEREKTLSVTKKAYEGTSLAETPEGCFYDLMKENRRLLKERCLFDAAEMNSPEDFIKNGPNLLFLYHPALGPLYSIIAQKLVKGCVKTGSELQIEAAAVSITNLQLDGSLLISAKNVVGSMNPSTQLLDFGAAVGRCVLENVSVSNAGIDRGAANIYWKNRIHRKEAVQIILEGDSEFIARNVTFTGNRTIRVQDGQRVVAQQEVDGRVTLHTESLSPETSWCWRYSLDAEHKIVLSS